MECLYMSVELYNNVAFYGGAFCVLGMLSAFFAPGDLMPMGGAAIERFLIFAFWGLALVGLYLFLNDATPATADALRQCGFQP